MTLYNLDFEALSNNDSITSGVISPFTAVVGGASALTADTTRAATGSVSARVDPAASAVTRIDLTSLSTSAAAVRMPFYFTTLTGTADMWMIGFYNGSTRLCSAFMNSAGAIRLADASSGGNNSWTAPATFPTNQWVWLNLYAVAEGTGAAGQFRCSYDSGDPNSSTQDSGLLTSQNIGTAGSFTEIRTCKVNAGAPTTTFWVDDIVIDDAATDIIIPPPPQPVATGYDNHFPIVASDGVPPYSIARTAGEDVTEVELAAGIWAIPKHLTGTSTWVITDDDDIDSEPMVVPALFTGQAPRVLAEPGPSTDWVELE